MRPFTKTLIMSLCLVFAGTTQAQVSLSDKEQLVAALTAGPPCCVIDGRTAASRKSDVLKNALPWRANIKINPTGTVVVIADRDQDALGIAQALGRKHPGKPVLAVKGGLATWKAVSFSLLMAAGMDPTTSGPVSFVIPANTCEQGKPLQELRPDKKKLQ